MAARRVDAARNRERVLEAAVHEHARHGSALGMQEVARRAGVGIGTVYRHFPSRQALIEAIAYPFFERGLVLARSVQRGHPAAERFDAYARGFALTLAAHGVPGQCTWDAPAAEPVRAELRALIGEFVESGKRAGTLRRDMTAEDAFTLLWTIAALVAAAHDATPGIWQRHVDLLLDGLSGRPPAELPAAAVDREQWDRFVRSARISVEHREPPDPSPSA